MSKDKTKIKAADVRAQLRKRFSDHRRYAYAEEVGNATGLEQTRRLDAVVVDVYKSNGYSIEGIEIKVSKADLMRELQDSSKHNIFFDSLDYYSLATTYDVLLQTPKDVIPPHWGIYEGRAFDNGEMSLSVRRKPLSLHDKQASAIDRPFFACLVRAIACQSPTAEQISAAVLEAEERTRKHVLAGEAHNTRRVEQLEAELEAFKVFREKCRLWGAGSVERGISKYEKIQGVDLTSLYSRLDYAEETIQKIMEAIPEELRPTWERRHSK